jgi:tetratricopeptide (TPR) repeat protein
MKKKFSSGNPLEIVCVIGFFLALVIVLGMVFLTFVGGRQGSPATTFTAELQSYDLFDAPRRALEGENPAQIEERLSRLQKLAGSVEEQLSVLKRRRALAQIDRRYIDSYKNAAREAAEAYAYSSLIAAVAAEALLLGGAPQGDDLDRLKNYGSRVSQSRFGLLELGIHFFTGDLENSARAVALPGIDRLLSEEYPALTEQIRRDLLIDDFLLRVYRRDISGASQRLDTLLAASSESMNMAQIPSVYIPTELTRLGAEFYYDHNNPLKAAQLFLILGGETDIERAADSLFLAGEVSGARNIWFTLSSGTMNVDLVARPAGIPVRTRSYYNLAATAANREDETYWLEQMFSALNLAANLATNPAANPAANPARSSPSGSSAQAPMDSARLFSILRYSRLLQTDTANAILGDAMNGDYSGNPLLDLELLRRAVDSFPPTRAAAEVWMLLGRHPTDEAVYEWAAWYFALKKLYPETDRLLLEAGRKGMYGAWYDLHRGLALLREGKTNEGERVFKEAVQDSSPDWRIMANLGRIYESRRSISTALEYYESAAALVSEKLPQEKPAAAQVQMRISRCLEALGRMEESRRAVEYAYELDPDNLNIRRELRRVSGGI